MTSFGARERQSKTPHEEPVKKLEDNRWTAKVFKYLHRKSVGSQLRKRTTKVTTRCAEGQGGEIEVSNDEYTSQSVSTESNEKAELPLDM